MARKSSKTQDKSAANLGFEAKLWLAADKLRNNMDAAEYKHVVLGLIFLKYISDSFEKHRAKLLAGDGDYDGANPEDPDEYRAENIFWVPTEARWAHLQANAKQPTIGKIVDDAMVAIERDKIELNRRMNATLEAMAQALLQSWFVDFDPVRRNMDTAENTGLTRRREERGEQPSEASDLRASVFPRDPSDALFPAAFQDSALGEIPEGWTVKSLPEVIEVNPRRTLSKGSIAPYLDMKNLPTQGYSADEVVDHEFGSGTKFKNGDTLLARITPCLENGKTGFVDFFEDGQVGWGSTEYIVFSPKPPLPPQFGYLLARSEKLRTHAIQNMTGTSGRQRVPAECFNSFFLAMPSPEIAKRFGELISPLFARIQSNSNKSRSLATLRDTLLPKLLSGELPIPTAKYII